MSVEARGLVHDSCIVQLYAACACMVALPPAPPDTRLTVTRTRTHASSCVTLTGDSVRTPCYNSVRSYTLHTLDPGDPRLPHDPVPWRPNERIRMWLVCAPDAVLSQLSVLLLMASASSSSFSVGGTLCRVPGVHSHHTAQAAALMHELIRWRLPCTSYLLGPAHLRAPRRAVRQRFAAAARLNLVLE